MSEITLYPRDSRIGAIMDQVSAIRQERRTDVMTAPTYEGEFRIPSTVVDGMVSSPDQSLELRGLLGASVGDALVSLEVREHISGGRQTLIRHCGPENDRGTRDVRSTLSLVAFPAGRLATLAARFTRRQPNQSVRILAWQGLGLPAEN